MSKKHVIAIALLSPAFIIPLAYASGLIYISKLSFTNSTTTLNPSESNPTVFFDPSTIVKDYLLDPGFQVGDKFQIHVNVSGVTDLYTWNINVAWNAAILNFTRIVSYGDLLSRTSSPFGTSRIYDVKKVSNTTGSAAIAESILGNYAGVSGGGQLVTMEFLITGYGSTDLAISTSGSLPTNLLDSTGVSMSFTTANSYFRNSLRGDINGDRTVNILDVSGVSAHWYPGPPIGPLSYGREADINDDGEVNILDVSIVSANWNRTVP